MAEKILTSVDMGEETAFPPKVNWSNYLGSVSGSILEGLSKQCYSVKRVKDNYLVESPEDDNKLAIAYDFQERDVEAWNLLINVNNGGKLGTIKPSSITIKGFLGTIKYDEGDFETIEWTPNVLGGYNRYLVSSNKVTFPTAYVVRGVGELLVNTANLSIEVTYEDGTFSLHIGSNIILTNNFNQITLTVGGLVLDPFPDPDTGLTTTTQVILRYDFSNIVGNGTILYNPKIYSVYYNTTGSANEMYSTVLFKTPTLINSNNAFLEHTLGTYTVGSNIYLWIPSSGNYYCGEARTSVQMEVDNLIYLKNELGITPKKYRISGSGSTYYITIYVNKG